MNATQQLKIAFIKQAHAQDKMVTLAIFAKELEDDLEVAQHIVSEYAHEFEQHIQVHMRNMLEAQLKLNAGLACVVETLLQHLTQLADGDVAASAAQATKSLLDKYTLH